MCKNYFMCMMLAKTHMLVKAYNICQITNIQLLRHIHLYPRIPVDYSPMESLSIDLKVMLKRFDDFEYLFVATWEIINLYQQYLLKLQWHN